MSAAMTSHPRATFRCDHCGETVHPDINAYWVGADETSECPADWERGHEVDGRARA